MADFGNHHNRHPLLDSRTGRSLVAQHDSRADGQSAIRPPHHLTRREYIAGDRLAHPDSHPDAAAQEHAQLVSRAIERGEDVPARVLQDYPELEGRALLVAHEREVERQKREAEELCADLDAAGIPHGGAEDVRKNLQFNSGGISRI